MNISLFNGLPSKGQAHFSSSKMKLDDFLNGVKYGNWQKPIEIIRTEQDKAKRDILKKQLPAVTISGVFAERKEDLLVEHSGFIQIDIDYFTNKADLINDIYTYSIFKSSSGGGLCVIVKINPDKHKESFRWLESYYFASYGIKIDSAPQNPASLRFVSYDPEITINEKSKVAKVLTAKPKKTYSLPIVLPGDTVGEMISECVNLRHNIAEDYESYRNLGFALADGFGETARQWFHNLCSVSDKYDSRQADKQFNECLKSRKNGISIGSFYWMLKNVGIHAPKQSNSYTQIAAMAKKAGRSPEAVKVQLHQINGIDEKQADKLVDEVYKRNDIDIKSSINDPEQLIIAVMEWLSQNHPMRINSITRIIEENGSDVRKERINSMYLRCKMFFNSKDITKDLLESFIFSDFIHEFNPIQEYIDKNIHRKSTGNIDALCKSIRSDTPMKEIFIRKWLISLIAAHEGNPVRSVLALVGGQNTGKTEWFRRLLPDKLHKYYAESKLDAGKDDDILMCQKLIVMDDEMGGKSKQDEKRFKELTSKSVFSLRAPYARSNEDFKRLAVLCGTSNETDIINDPTGNTRILPVEVLSIDHELYNSIDKNELFMEAYRSNISNDCWQLTKDELASLNIVNRDYESTPFERELINQFFIAPESGTYPEFLTATEIKDVIEMNTKQKIISFKKFGIELKKLFGRPVSKKIKGVALYRYEVVRFKSN